MGQEGLGIAQGPLECVSSAGAPSGWSKGAELLKTLLQPPEGGEPGKLGGSSFKAEMGLEPTYT